MASSQLSIEEAAKYVMNLHYRESRKAAIEDFEKQYGSDYADAVKRIVVSKFKPKKAIV